MNVICYGFIAHHTLFVKMLVYQYVLIVKFLDSSSNIRLFFGTFEAFPALKGGSSA